MGSALMEVRVGKVSLYFKRYGRGFPLLVMHGGPGVDHSYLRPYLDALGDVAELIYYDHRGNGRSSGQEMLGTTTLESLADDADQLRQALKIPKMVLLGHGFGGFVAQTYARMFPHALRGLVLANTSAAFDYPAEMLAQAYKYGGPDAISALLANIRAPVVSDEVLRAQWREALPLYFCRYQPMFGPSLDEGTIYSAAAYNRGMFDLAPHFNSCAWLQKIKTPTLVLAGAHDWLAPRKEGIEPLMANLPHAQLETFEQSGHYPFIEQPKAFAHTVKHFLRALPP